MKKEKEIGTGNQRGVRQSDSSTWLGSRIEMELFGSFRVGISRLIYCTVLRWFVVDIICGRAVSAHCLTREFLSA